MKFRMITTFFGAHSFGGDAAYVDRLSQALCRRGHEVHVYYCVDAFNAVRGDHPLRSNTRRRRAFTFTRSRAPSASSRPWPRRRLACPFQDGRAASRLLDDPETDVIHFHNISLVGGPGVLGPGRQSPRSPDHDRARALADLPDASALEVRSRAL